MQQITLQKINQSFTTTFAGVQYSVDITYRQLWIMNVSSVSGERILSGIPLIYGVDLFEQYSHLNFNCKLYCMIASDNIILYIITE